MTDRREILDFLYRKLELLGPAGMEFREETDLVESLGLDSTTVIDLVMDLEDEFEVAVPLNALADIRTVGELAGLVEDSHPPEA